MEDVDFRVAARSWDELDGTATRNFPCLARGRTVGADIIRWSHEPISIACGRSRGGQLGFDVMVVFPPSTVLPMRVSGPQPVGTRFRHGDIRRTGCLQAVPE